MNAYRRGLSVLIIIVATVFALYAYRFFPEKRYNALADPAASIFVFGSTLPNGESSASWLNQNENEFRCEYPKGIPDSGYYCSFNLGYIFGANTGKDLSHYHKINLFVEYEGTAPKMRLFARNYSTAYTNPTDTNSSKYNAIYIATRDLNREITLDVREFVVAEWWLIAYNISRENSFPEFDNVVNLGIDFSDSMTVGNHDVRVKKIEFVGEWISRESWYLIILSLWLAIVFINTVRNLNTLRVQKIQQEKVIQKLNKSNRDLADESDRFKRLSTVDPLTGLYNRFGLDQIVNTLMESENEIHRGTATFSIVLLDIDYFKRVNDHRGHDVGDRVLQDMADILRKSLRPGDYVGRWGGEEFLVILPFTDHGMAVALAEKTRILVSQHIFEPDKPLAITVSAGISTLIGGESFADLFKRADAALYQAKRSGRNCCISAEKYLIDYFNAQ